MGPVINGLTANRCGPCAAVGLWASRCLPGFAGHSRIRPTSMEHRLGTLDDGPVRFIRYDHGRPISALVQDVCVAAAEIADGRQQRFEFVDGLECIAALGESRRGGARFVGIGGGSRRPPGGRPGIWWAPPPLERRPPSRGLITEFLGRVVCTGAEAVGQFLDAPRHANVPRGITEVAADLASDGRDRERHKSPCVGSKRLTARTKPRRATCSRSSLSRPWLRQR